MVTKKMNKQISSVHGSSVLTVSGITTKYMLQLIFFLFQIIFVFGYGMVMYANEFESKENQKLTEIKNILQHIQALILIQQPIIPYYKR